jgi:hypothetical protein
LNKFILARSGWITRFIVPYFLKNYSSHLIGDNKANIVGKIFSLFGRKNGKATTSAAVPGYEN